MSIIISEFIHSLQGTAMSRLIIPVLMVLMAAFSRLLPHPPNVAPITALALFSGVYLGRKYSFIIPIAAMVLSDLFIGFYSGVLWVYAAFLAIGGIGVWLRTHRGIVQTA